MLSSILLTGFSADSSDFNCVYGNCISRPCFFYSIGTQFIPGIYLAVHFYQPGKKLCNFFTRLVKRMARYMPRLARVKPGGIKNT